MKIIFSPYDNDANQYINNQKKALISLGHELIRVDSFVRDKLQADAVILQWYERISGRTVIGKLRCYCRKLVEIMRMKKAGIKIITVFNNREPHDTKGLNRVMSRKFSKRLYKTADGIVIMSKHAIPYLREYISTEDIHKVFLVPHPNYIKQPSADVVERKKESQFVVLYSGLIRPYKNIELIVNIASSLTDYPILFKIHGMGFEKDYTEKLSHKVQNLRNLDFKAEFIPDNAIDELIQSSDVQIFPLDKASSIHSGSIIHAFSNGRTVICSNIPAVRDFPSELCYVYDYESNEKHEEALKKQVIRAYEDWEYRNDAFVKKGKRLYELISEHNSLDAVAQAFEEMLGRIQ